MTRSSKVAVAGVLVLSVWLSAGAAVGDVLVTTGGSRYRGEVSREGNTYVVVKADGGRIVLPASMVREVIAEAAASRPAAGDSPPNAAPATAPATPVRAPATGPATRPRPPANPAEARLRQRVQRISFRENKLADCLQFLRDLTGVSIHVDWQPLKAEGLAPNTPITLELKDVTAETGLKMILKAPGKGNVRHAVDWASVVVISTPDGLKRLLTGGPKDWTAPRRPTAEEQAVLRKLLTPVDRAEFHDIKAEDVLAFIRDFSAVNLAINWQQVAPRGLERTTPISLNLRRTPIARVLELALAGHGVKIALRGNIVHLVAAER